MKRKNNDEKIERIIKRLGIGYVVITIIICFASEVFAASDPISVVNNLSNFIFSLIRAIGMILLGLGIMQVGLSLKSHDPSQRANVRPDLGVTKVN